MRPRLPALGQKPVAMGLVEQVDLVPDLDDAAGIGGVHAEVGKDLLHILGLGGGIGVGNVPQMQDEVGLHHLLQRGAEGGHQMGRQIGNEADRVRQDDRRAMRQAHAPQRGVERGEQHVLRQHARPGQPVEQGGLAGIGVADDRHHRKRHLAALGAVQVAGAPHGFQLALQPDDPVLQHAPVGLDLGFAGAAQEAGAAALALQVGPAPHQPALLVIEMGKLHLQRAFLGARPLAEYLQDQPGAVQHLDVQFLFEIALLHRRQRMVDDGELGAAFLHHRRKLGHLARAQQRGRARLGDGDGRRVDRVEVDGARKPDRLFQARFRRTRQARPARIVLAALPAQQYGHDNHRASRRPGLRAHIALGGALRGAVFGMRVAVSCQLGSGPIRSGFPRHRTSEPAGSA